MKTTVANDDKKLDEKLMEDVYQYLKDAKEELFNPDNTPVSIRILSQDLGTDENRIKKICKKLVDDTSRKPRVEPVKAGRSFVFYRIASNHTKKK